MRVRSFVLTLRRQRGQRLTNGYRIVEYATREQAQQAVAQLSNQNLMGRLVYVREVSRLKSELDWHRLTTFQRTVRPSHDLSVPPEATAAGLAEACLAALTIKADIVALLAQVVDRST